MPVKIIIHGAGGRMGQAIARSALADPELEISAAIERSGHPALGTDIGRYARVADCGVLIQETVSPSVLSSSVVIDFSAPDACVRMIELACESGSNGFVAATTGLDTQQRSLLESASKKIPVLNSPNMSLGVNLLFYLTEEAAKRLGKTFDIEIIEAHHRHKKDAPSGTARELGIIAARAAGLTYDTDVVHGRHGIVGERGRAEIGMHAVRGGDIVGDHLVLFAGDGERVELRHSAHTRETFAYGAVAAAKWLSGKPAGAMYSMRDVLGL